MIGRDFLLPSQEFGYFIALIAVLGAWEWTQYVGLCGAACAPRLCRRDGPPSWRVSLMASRKEVTMAILTTGAAWWLLALLLVVRYPKRTAFGRLKWCACLLAFWCWCPCGWVLWCLKRKTTAPIDSVFDVCGLGRRHGRVLCGQTIW